MVFLDEEKPSLDDLSHHGIKGMKWGVRKNENVAGPRLKQKTQDLQTKLSNGDVVSLDGYPTSAMTKFVASIAPSRIQRYNDHSSFKIKDSSGQQVGELHFSKESPTSINVAWIGVNSKQRGAGYATATMKAVIDHAKKQKLDTVTLEVPGRSPDARHVYEKLGFKDVGVVTTPEQDAIWGGLTKMQLNLK